MRILSFITTIIISILILGCSKQEIRNNEISLLREADDAISQGNFDEAILILEKIILLDSNEAKAYLKLGLIYEKIRHNPDEAKKYYQKVLDIEKDETLRNQVNKWMRAIEKSGTPEENKEPDGSTDLIRLVLHRNRLDYESQIARVKEQYEKEIKDLKTRLASKSGESESFENSRGDFQSMDSGNPLLEDLKKRIKELESDITVARENDSIHIERYASAQKALEEEKAKYTELEERFFELEKNYRIALARVSELTDEKVTDDRLPDGEKELSEARKRINELQQQLVKSKNDLSIAENDLQKLKAEYQKLINEKSTANTASKTGTTGASKSNSRTKTDIPGVKEVSGDIILYVVQQGDTLSRISEKFYGDRKKWNYIFNMNKDLLKNQNDIKVGDTIKVPILK